MTSISAIAHGRCRWRAPTKNNLELANMAPFREPNVEQATKKGITKENEPSILSAKVTATACEARISSVSRTTKYAMFVTTYTIVTSGIDMQIAFGRFLHKKQSG